MKQYCILILVFVIIEVMNCVMLRKECPTDEMHRSCWFFDEYTCWEKADKMERIKLSPKRLTHCRSGCFCKRGYVRAYPQGKCIAAMHCRNRKLQYVMSKLPDDFVGFNV